MMIRAGTHLLAIAAGWGLWSAGGGDLLQRGATRVDKALKFRSHQRVERPGGRSAREILDDIAGNGKNRLPEKVRRVDGYKARLVEAEELAERAEQMAATVDPAATATEQLQSYLNRLHNGQPVDPKEAAELEVRLLQWMNLDPKGAITWFSTKTREDLAEVAPFLRKSLDVMIGREGVEEAGKWIGVNSRMDGELTRAIADHAGAAGDLAQLGRLKEGLDHQQWSNIRLSLIDTWPMAKADDLFRLSQTEGAPLAVLLYAKQQGPAGVEWLQKQLASDAVDPAFKASLLKHHDYHQLMYASPQLDFDKRVEVVQSFEPGKPVEQVKMELGVFDVVNTLNSGRDWRFAFRNGKATAEEIYGEMAKALPELAAKSPESLKLQLYKELSEFGGARASGLLDGVPADQKAQMAMKAPQWQFLQANPQDFHDFVRTIPVDPGNPEVWETRLRTWEDKTRRYRTRLGPQQYDQWVRNLPEGIDREMASYALVRQMGPAGAEQAADLRGKIQDAQLKQRLEGAP